MEVNRNPFFPRTSDHGGPSELLHRHNHNKSFMTSRRTQQVIIMRSQHTQEVT